MDTPNRFEILNAVKDPLGLYVLVILVVEASLIGVSATVSGAAQVVAIAGSVGLLATLVLVVAFTAWKNPGALRQPAWLSRAEREGNRVTGYWWQSVAGDDEATLSLVEISAARGALSLAGRTYMPDGTWMAQWRSSASFMDPDTRCLYYHWTGEHPIEPDRSFEGFGDITFNGEFDSAHGDFIDVDTSDWSGTQRRFARYSRCEPGDARAFERAGGDERTRMVRDRLSS